MGPAGTKQPGGNEPQDFRFDSGYGASTSDASLFYQQTATKWARLWVHLPTLWPDTNSVDTNLLYNLDYQIAFARALSSVQGVILTFHHDLPNWINAADRASFQRIYHQPGRGRPSSASSLPATTASILTGPITATATSTSSSRSTSPTSRRCRTPGRMIGAQAQPSPS
jgi:hypothetical protein